MSTDTFTLDDLKAAVARKAGEDAAFRQALLAAPKATVEKLLGTDLPGHVQVQAIEEAPDTYVVVLPARAVLGELSDADLEAVAGGATKAENDRNFRFVASLAFGGVAATAAMGVGLAARDAGDDKTMTSAMGAAGQISSCGVGWGK